MNQLHESAAGPSMADGSRAARPIGSGPAAAIPTDLDWDLLDGVVQDSLATLTARILAREPGVRWKASRNSARAFPLFSYRVFDHLDGDDRDPVVVGLTFTVRDSRVRVAGDISGDESGVVYFDGDCTIDVPAEPPAVRDAARVVADRLAAQAPVVLEAIRHRHPRSVAR